MEECAGPSQGAGPSSGVGPDATGPALATALGDLEAPETRDSLLVGQGLRLVAAAAAEPSQAQAEVLSDRDILKLIFASLEHRDLCRCTAMCRMWSEISRSADFWTDVSLEAKRVNPQQVCKLGRASLSVGAVLAVTAHLCGSHGPRFERCAAHCFFADEEWQTFLRLLYFDVCGWRGRKHGSRHTSFASI
jgi:F-box-like